MHARILRRVTPILVALGLMAGVALPAHAWTSSTLLCHVQLTSGGTTSITLDGSAGNCVAGGITGFDNLRLLIHAKATSTSVHNAVALNMIANNDTQAHYGTQWSGSNGSADWFGSNYSQTVGFIGNVPNKHVTFPVTGFGSVECVLTGYFDNSSDKVAMCRDFYAWNTTYNLVNDVTNWRWYPGGPASTAINSLYLSLSDGSAFENGSSFDLYGE